MSYIIEDLKNNSTPLIEKAIEEIEALEREKQVSAMEYLALEGQCREHLDKIDAMRKDAERYLKLRRMAVELSLSHQVISQFVTNQCELDAAIKGEQAC
jgi:hypothetical protein